MKNVTALKQHVSKKNTLIGSMLLSVALMTPQLCFGASVLADAFKQICSAVGILFSDILNPVCVVMLAVCLFRLILGGNSKSAEASLSSAKRIVCCWVLFSCLGLLAKYGTDLMSQIGGGYAW